MKNLGSNQINKKLYNKRWANFDRFISKYLNDHDYNDAVEAYRILIKMIQDYKTSEIRIEIELRKNRRKEFLIESEADEKFQECMVIEGIKKLLEEQDANVAETLKLAEEDGFTLKQRYDYYMSIK
jgi:transcriptional regulator of heat shock response